MRENIYERDSFLNNIAKRFNRPVRKRDVIRPELKFNPQLDVLKEKTQDELVQVLINQCTKIQTDTYLVTKEELPRTLNEVFLAYRGGPIVCWEDHRIDDFHLRSFLEKSAVHMWDPVHKEKNIAYSEQANIGITFSDITLAESGTVVLFSSKEKGRSVSLLPKTYISIIPKSTIVPRFTQAAQKIRQMVNEQKMIASCINFISGPSNSADIEMNLVVGVHGPVKATYIIVEDA
ncbi:LutC/YkgG family protein [Bacillus kexueae]|uniref:LutC/YkgG family protein n=1 Tax=Aeribacillus kexueae TaxID=2078952 RepID=UPI001FAF1521|nr:lactate utilization protein C [Bacillus kexueae]